MITIKNEELMDMLEFLEKIELVPKVSRVRTRLCGLLKVKTEALYHDEVELLEKYGKKDENGKLIETDGTFSLETATALTYHKEKAELLQEESNIDVTELKDRLMLLKEALEESDIKVGGKDAETLDTIITQLEREVA
jgi:Protein of unknown function (DUF1617).